MKRFIFILFCFALMVSVGVSYAIDPQNGMEEILNDVYDETGKSLHTFDAFSAVWDTTITAASADEVYSLGFASRLRAGCLIKKIEVKASKAARIKLVGTDINLFNRTEQDTTGWSLAAVDTWETYKWTGTILDSLIVTDESSETDNIFNLKIWGTCPSNE